MLASLKDPLKLFSPVEVIDEACSTARDGDPTFFLHNICARTTPRGQRALWDEAITRLHKKVDTKYATFLFDLATTIGMCMQRDLENTFSDDDTLEDNESTTSITSTTVTFNSPNSPIPIE